MSKFFNIDKQNGNNFDGGNNFNNGNNNNNIQGYIAPSNMYPNNGNNNQEPETFVYDSYQKNNMNNGANGGTFVSPTSQGVIAPSQGVMQQVQESPQYNNYNSANMMNNNANMNSSVSNVNANINNVTSSGYSGEQMEVLEMPMMNQEIENNKVEELLDPLNNANNPIPVNPVAPPKEVFEEEELPKDVKANIFSVIGMMFGMVLTPGTTIVSNAKKYRSTSKAMMITLWITVVSLLLCVAARVVAGAFNKTYNAITGAYTINFNFANIFSLENYLEYLIIALIVSFVAIMIVALVYYASSFLNSKGVPMGSYMMVSNLALLPFIIGVVVVFPVINLISSYLAMLALIFSFLYSVTSLLIGIGDVLTFKNINTQILYNVLNLSIVIMIVFTVVAIFIKTNILILPEISI